MRPSFQPLLINGPFDDPGLFVSLAYRRRALLFDLGDLGKLAPGDLIKTTHVFVSHTHMDHFIGFDQLLRLLLGRTRRLRLFGPPGFLKQVTAKLQAYTWNLVRNYDQGLEITATEVHAAQRLTQTFDCQQGFKPTEPKIIYSAASTIHREPAFQADMAILDHQIPSLAFALKERFHINILTEPLKAMGLATGPWASRFKELLFSRADPETIVEVPRLNPQKRPARLTLNELTARAARITPGQKIAYVADAIGNQANEEKIVSLVQDADHLFIEAAFLDCHRELAKAKHHLTARQAGYIARKARVRKMTIFHFSPRYTNQGHLLEQEARKEFSGQS